MRPDLLIGREHPAVLVFIRNGAIEKVLANKSEAKIRRYHKIRELIRQLQNLIELPERKNGGGKEREKIII